MALAGLAQAPALCADRGHVANQRRSFRGTCAPAAVAVTPLSLLAQGEAVDEIIEDYPALERDDILACLAYAHAVIAHDRLDFVETPGK